MPSERSDILVICHVSAAEAASNAARALFLEPNDTSPSENEVLVDILCYGRSSPDRPAPPGARFVGPSVQENISRWQAVRMLGELRNGGYRLVALSQPALVLSRARGLLVAFTYVVSRGESLILDPVSVRVVGSICLKLTLQEVTRWLTLQLVSRVFATTAAPLLRRLAERPTVRRTPAQAGSVVYLRTDIDLRIAPLAAGGSVAHTEGILQALLQRGYTVAYWGTGEVGGVPAAVNRRRLPALLKGNLPTEIAELISGVVQGLLPLAGTRRAERRPTAFVYQRYSLNNLAGVILSRRAGVPLVLEANGSETKWRQDFGSVKYPRLAYACEQLILSRADVIAAVSENAAEDLRTAGAPPDRLRVVPNGVSVARFVNAKPMPLPENLHGRFVACFVGLFYPWHGVRFLAEAFALLHKRHNDVRLLLVGDGEEAPAVRAVLARHGVLDAVHFTGVVSRDAAPRYMASADALVSPHADVHRFIGSPIKLFEYMAAGKPIVATKVGQIPEVLCDEVNALLVPPERPDAMADALERLYHNRHLARRLGRSAQAEAVAHHSWDGRLTAILKADGASSPTAATKS